MWTGFGEAFGLSEHLLGNIRGLRSLSLVLAWAASVSRSVQVCQLRKQWGNWGWARKLLLIGIGLMTKKTIPFQYLTLKLLWAISLHKDLTLKFPQIPLIFSTHWAEQVKVVSTEPVPLALSLVPGSQGQMRARLEGGRFAPWQYWHLEGVGPRA